MTCHKHMMTYSVSTAATRPFKLRKSAGDIEKNAIFAGENEEKNIVYNKKISL